MTVEQHFADYQAYHQNAKNKGTHYIGVPLIVFALLNLLYQVKLFDIAGWSVEGAVILFVSVSLFYLSLSVRLALGMAVLTVPLYVIAARAPWPVGLAAFVIGWVFQLVGHHIEGKKPAFVHNFVHLFIGPLWITSHWMEKMGLWKPSATAQTA